MMMARTNVHKKGKVQDRILQDVNVLLRKDMSDIRLRLITVTKVEITDDLSQAKIYWDIFDTNKKTDAEGALKRALKFFRSELASSLQMRKVPEIKFVYDAQYEAEQKITKLLQLESNRIAGIDAGEDSDE